MRADGGGYHHMDRDEFARLARAGDAPTNALLRGGYCCDSVTKVDGDEGSRKLRFVISTASRDRHRDTVAADGWNLTNFRKNPVVLWAHDYHNPPVGRAHDTRVERNRLVSVAEFADAETYAFADTVFRLYKGGFLKAVSVGFLPVRWEINEDERGLDFTEQELLEYSAVPVPANPEALADARAAGVDVAPVVRWAERTLDEWALVRPEERLHLERGWRAARSGTSVVVDVDLARVAERIADAVLPVALDAADEAIMRRTGRLPDRSGARVGGAP